MQLQLNHAISDFSEIKHVDRKTSIGIIRASDNNLTLARILDKFNVALRDGKIEICAECLAS
jgi:hypothetical protein